MGKTEGSEHVLAHEPSSQTGLPAEGKDRADTRVPSACRKESVATGTGVFDQDRTFHV